MHTYAFSPARVSSFHSSLSNKFNSSNFSTAAPAAQPEDTSDLLPRDISSRFGLRLREMRRAQNMTQLRMAIDFGIDRSFISDVERGRKSISLHMLEVIALGMKVSLSDLFRGL
jgi:DNA-binding XRE family transcriptional regulator